MMKMMKTSGRTAVRAALQLTSLLLVVLGLVMGLSGVYLLLKYWHGSVYFDNGYITMPAILALVSAVFLAVAGCLGSWLSLRDSTCLQGLVLYLLLVIFCLESTAAGLAYFHSVKLDSEMTSLSGVFQNYTGNSHDPGSQAVDTTQKELQCCGIHGYRDWFKTSWFNRTGGLNVPQSCCNSTFLSCSGTVEQPLQLYAQGCQVKLEMALQFVLRVIICGFPVIFLVEVLVVIMMAQLMRERPFLDYHILGKN